MGVISRAGMAHGPLVVTDKASGRDDAVGRKEGAKHDTAPGRPRGDCTGPFPSSFAARRRADPSPRQRIRQSTSLVARRPGKASEASTRRILRVIRAEEGGAPPSDLSGRPRTCIRCAHAKHGYGKLNWVAPGDSPKSTCSLGTHGARDVLGADFRCVADGWSPHGMPTLPGPRSIIARIPIADCLGRRGWRCESQETTGLYEATDGQLQGCGKGDCLRSAQQTGVVTLDPCRAGMGGGGYRAGSAEHCRLEVTADRCPGGRARFIAR